MNVFECDVVVGQKLFSTSVYSCPPSDYVKHLPENSPDRTPSESKCAFVVCG